MDRVTMKGGSFERIIYIYFIYTNRIRSWVIDKKAMKYDKILYSLYLIPENSMKNACILPLFKGKVFYSQEHLSGQSATTECGVNYQLLAVMLLMLPNGELLVAVDQNQLMTMASQTVDPIDWSHPPPSWAVPPERLVHSINQCSLSRESTR